MTIALRKTDLNLDAIAPLNEMKVLNSAARPAAGPELMPATGVHPVAVTIPVATATWFVAVAWCAFGVGETSLVLAVITVFCIIFFGLFVGGAAICRDMTPEREHSRGFWEFLGGDVDIATGRISGLETLIQIGTMPIGLGVGFTIIALIAIAVR